MKLSIREKKKKQNCDGQHVLSFILVTAQTFQFEMSPLNGALANVSRISMTAPTFHLEMSPLNEVKPNMYPMLFTRETSHFDRSLLNWEPSLWSRNMRFMSITAPTFHLETSPLNFLAPSNTATAKKREKQRARARGQVVVL